MKKYTCAICLSAISDKPFTTKKENFYFHKTCFLAQERESREWKVELDEPLNNCKYFQRESGNFGHYVRDGAKHSCFGHWTRADVEGWGIFTDLENKEVLASFSKFIKENYPLTWFSPRKEFNRL